MDSEQREDVRQYTSSMLRRLEPTGFRGDAVMLVPSAVERTMSLVPGAPPNILVGAIFAAGLGAESAEGDLALIFQARDGGLENALRSSPTLRIAVNDAVVFDGSIEGLSLLVTGHADESLMVMVSRGLLERIASGSIVRVWMGNSCSFELEATHLHGIRALLGEIPEGTVIGLPRPLYRGLLNAVA